MFVEKKLNKSGSTSVRIMRKVHGKRKCVKVMGCSSDAEETGLLIKPLNRIEAHVCICFTAYTILLELERTFAKTADKKNKKPGITIYRVKFFAESLYEIEYVNPYNGKKKSVMLRTDYDEEVVKLLDTIDIKP